MDSEQAAPINLDDGVSYQAQSIVSRVLLKKPSGTVTVFAFDQGQALSEHTAPFDALVVILEGEAEVFVGGQPFRLKSHDSLMLPANVPHALNAPARFKMLLTMIRTPSPGPGGS